MRILFTPHYVGTPVIVSSYPRRGAMPLAQFDNLEGLALDESFVTPNNGNMIHAEALAKIIECDRSKSVIGMLPPFAKGNNVRANRSLERHFDLVIFGYANILHSFAKLTHAQRTKLETEFARQRTFFEKSSIRVAAFGIGLQDEMPAVPDSIGPELYRLLQVLNDRADVIGTRGERTAQFLHDLGITRAQPLGCPSVIANPRGVLDPQLPVVDGKLKVGASGRLSASGRNSGRMTPLLNLSAAYDTDFAFQNDIYNLFRPGTRAAVPYNSESCEVDREACEAAGKKLFKTAPGFRRYWYFRSPDAWRSWAATRDIYLGDRFHGGVAFLQAGRPAGFLYGDVRVNELTYHYGLPSFSFDEAKRRGVHDLLAEIVDPATRDRVRKVYSRRLADFRDACAKAGLPLRASIAAPEAADAA